MPRLVSCTLCSAQNLSPTLDPEETDPGSLPDLGTTAIGEEKSGFGI